MIRRLLRRLRLSITARRWSAVGAVMVTVGLGWYVVGIQPATAGSSAQRSGVWSSGPGQAVSSSEVFTLTVLHTNDTWGYVDPCG
jgi:hypothetical protein